MRHSMFFLLLLSAVCFSSCEKVMGGYIYEGISILEDDQVCDAHGYELECGPEGGVYTLQIISEGVSGVLVSKNLKSYDVPEWISIKEEPSYPPLSEDEYDSDNGNPVKQYLQNVSFEVQPNDKGIRRKAEAVITSGNSLLVRAAEITIIQSRR